MKKLVLILMMVFVFGGAANAVHTPIKVNLDYSEVPDLKDWAIQSKELIEQWYPRIQNLMITDGFTPPSEIDLKFLESDRGIAETVGGKLINVRSKWVREHPEDIGLVFHEMIHVLQQFGRTEHFWITEGTADYYRWAIYEGKPLSWFPVVNKPDGYKSAYQVSAGFLLWLESGRSPGIVAKIMTEMRRHTMTMEFFKTETGVSVDELWQEYLRARAGSK